MFETLEIVKIILFCKTFYTIIEKYFFNCEVRRNNVFKLVDRVLEHQRFLFIWYI